MSSVLERAQRINELQRQIQLAQDALERRESPITPRKPSATVGGSFNAGFPRIELNPVDGDDDIEIVEEEIIYVTDSEDEGSYFEDVVEYVEEEEDEINEHDAETVHVTNIHSDEHPTFVENPVPREDEDEEDQQQQQETVCLEEAVIEGHAAVELPVEEPVPREDEDEEKQKQRQENICLEEAFSEEHTAVELPVEEPHGDTHVEDEGDAIRENDFQSQETEPVSYESPEPVCFLESVDQSVEMETVEQESLPVAPFPTPETTETPDSSISQDYIETKECCVGEEVSIKQRRRPSLGKKLLKSASFKGLGKRIMVRRKSARGSAIGDVEQDSPSNEADVVLVEQSDVATKESLGKRLNQMVRRKSFKGNASSSSLNGDELPDTSERSTGSRFTKMIRRKSFKGNSSVSSMNVPSDEENTPATAKKEGVGKRFTKMIRRKSGKGASLSQPLDTEVPEAETFETYISSITPPESEASTFETDAPSITPPKFEPVDTMDEPEKAEYPAVPAEEKQLFNATVEIVPRTEPKKKIMLNKDESLPESYKEQDEARRANVHKALGVGAAPSSPLGRYEQTRSASLAANTSIAMPDEASKSKSSMSLPDPDQGSSSSASARKTLVINVKSAGADDNEDATTDAEEHDDLNKDVKYSFGKGCYYTDKLEKQDNLAWKRPEWIDKAKQRSPGKSPFHDNDDIDMGHKKIEWQKPDWTKKPILKSTGRGAALRSGVEIARPISQL